jgi:hypothetical protein
MVLFAASYSRGSRLFYGWDVGYSDDEIKELFEPCKCALTFSNPIFLPTAYSPALICFGWERGWWITCNCRTVLKEKNMEKQKEYNLCYLLAKVHTT